MALVEHYAASVPGVKFGYPKGPFFRASRRDRVLHGLSAAPPLASKDAAGINPVSLASQSESPGSRRRTTQALWVVSTRSEEQGRGRGGWRPPLCRRGRRCWAVGRAGVGNRRAWLWKDPCFTGRSALCLEGVLCSVFIQARLPSGSSHISPYIS